MSVTIVVEPPVSDTAPRCMGRRKDGRPCRRLLAALLTRPWAMKCPRCGHENVSR